jgi:hypothetical protein
MSGMGYMLGAFIADKQVINILTPVLIVPLMLFAGFFVSQDNIPIFLTPIKWISTFRYGFQAFMLNEYTDLTLECMSATDPTKGCNPLGDMNFDMTMMESIYAMLGIWFVTHLLAFLILSYKSNKYD